MPLKRKRTGNIGRLSRAAKRTRLARAANSTSNNADRVSEKNHSAGLCSYDGQFRSDADSSTVSERAEASSSSVHTESPPGEQTVQSDISPDAKRMKIARSTSEQQNILSPQNSSSIDHLCSRSSSPSLHSADRSYSIEFICSSSISRVSESLQADHLYSTPRDQSSSLCSNSPASLTAISPCASAVPVLTFSRTLTSTNRINFTAVSLPGPSSAERLSTSDASLSHDDASFSGGTRDGSRSSLLTTSRVPLLAQNISLVQRSVRIFTTSCFPLRPIAAPVPARPIAAPVPVRPIAAPVPLRPIAAAVPDALNSGASSHRTDRQGDTEIHEVPLPLPNYPAFRYNPHDLYDGGRIGSMSAKCRHCNAKKWPTEPPGMCCAKGKVDVPLLGNPPEPLRALLTENTSLSKEFRENIRKYNSCFVMTSFQAHTLVEPGFMPTFKVQGQIYHNIGPLTPAAEQQPQFVQIYFIDDRGQQADARLSWQIDRESQLNRETILRLQDMLQENNEHVRVFKTALEQRTPTMPEYRVVLREDRVPRGEHERTFNAPSGHDVAALVPEGQEGYRDIVLSDKDDRIMRIHEVHRSYDSLQYPLLFPLGEDGYHLSRRQKNPQTNVITTKKITMLQFYAFRLMQRDGDFNTLLRAGKLSHQFIVDVFAKIETDRLNHMRHHQDDLRAASYTTLRDAVEADGDPTTLVSWSFFLHRSRAALDTCTKSARTQ